MRARAEPLVLAAGAIYVLFVGWAMSSLSYDIWGALVAAPLLVLVTVPLLRRAFSSELGHLFPIAVAGLVAKFAGSAFRYWVAFDAYGGAADASAYHNRARQLAAGIRSGSVSLRDAIPHSTGTEFIDQLTGLFYAVFGSSILAGFLFYGLMAFWGAVFFVRAAVIAVPGLAARRYAALLFFVPTMLYWPSSIGKEAWLCLCLGVASYGIALLLSGRRSFSALVVTGLALAGAGFARPHFVAIWVGALVVALGFGVLTGSGGRSGRSRLGAAILVGVAAIGLFFVATATVRYLNPQDDSAVVATTDRLDEIFDETQRRTGQGGSSFDTITVAGPQDWPEAVVRTLTRPMLNEAGSLAELLPAIEMTLLLAWAMVGWRRFANIPRLFLKSSYLVFAAIALFMFGLAFARVGNLGLLTRQRSLVVPLLLVFWCVPRRSLPVSRPVPAPVDFPDLLVPR